MIYQYPMRAKSVDGQYVNFTVADAPVLIYDNQFILANRPGSPVLITESVCRMMDHLPVGEGDRVVIEGKPYTVTYMKGFNFRRDDNVIIPSHLIDTCEVLERSSDAGSKINFKYKDVNFPLFAIQGSYQGELAVAAYPKLIPPKELQMSAGFSQTKKAVFFGDLAAGAPLIMRRGRPCTVIGNEYVEFPGRNLLWKESD